MKNIVIIGGGTGTFTLLSGLRKYPANNTVIVSSADDGGSTGVLRNELGVMPPGDIRQCLVGLSYTQEEMKQLFNFRFDKGSLKGHNVGNIILAALEKISGAEQAIDLAGKILNVRGQVIPVTLLPTTLSATLNNGRKIVGEHNIDDQDPKGKTSPIKSLHLSPSKVNPRAVAALKNADVIIFGPGDLYTSILPNILVKGVAEAVNKSEAKKILVTNIMTKFGQTDGFKSSDFVQVVEQYLKGEIDIVISNNKLPASAIVQKYAREKAKFVEPNIKSTENLTAVATDLISSSVFKRQSSDKVKRSLLRHDSEKLAKLIWKLI